uniref:hypothetical protein n=1 Tax=Nocardioides jensenii TaxID=1843 RepID=UPI001FDF2838|nr:hypothetical protein [Nocardioides jensenii]
MLTIWVRRVAQRAVCIAAAAAVARARLNAITAQATQAALAEYFPLVIWGRFEGVHDVHDEGSVLGDRVLDAVTFRCP